MATAGRTYRGMTPAAREADRRRRLLAAGLEAFGTQGYASSTIEGLCASAGVAPRAFYDHFASREDLLAAVYDEVIAAHTATVVAALAGESDALEAHVRAGIGAAVQAWVAHPRRARVALVEVVGVSARMEAHRFAVIRAYADLLTADGERLAAAGLIPRRPGGLTAMALVGAITQVLTDWQQHPEARAPVELVVEELTRLHVAGLR